MSALISDGAVLTSWDDSASNFWKRVFGSVPSVATSIEENWRPTSQNFEFFEPENVGVEVLAPAMAVVLVVAAVVAVVEDFLLLPHPAARRRPATTLRHANRRIGLRIASAHARRPVA
jgi:hypothetical protein